MAFTSDLTIDEVLLVEEVGFEPVELVMGSSYFHIGWQQNSSLLWTGNMELGDIGRMMDHARRVAIGRMTQEAHACGADGVVGVRLEVEREGHNAEFTVLGTAVKRRQKAGRGLGATESDGGNWRQRNGAPFTCDLSGADFWALVRAGFRPVCFSFGVCVYHIAYQTLGQWFSTVARNTEMPAYTQALYDARELALGRMQYEALNAGATAGLVAVNVEESNHGWDSHILEMIAMGTGVAPILDAAHETHDDARVVIGAQDF